MIFCHELVQYLDEVLNVSAFKDYGPNGLQVEGKPEIKRIASGVTASLDLIEAAIEYQCDALLVHHGLFWRGQDGRLVGWLGQRVRRLMAHNINLFAYHLPLDAHEQWGNNAVWGQAMRLQADRRFGDQGLGFIAPSAESDLSTLLAKLELALGRTPISVAGDGRQLKRVAWCSGGAQGYFESAIAAGADVFLTGEISEPQAHLARETGVAFVACGHHATERYGARALGEHLAQHFGLIHQFIDINNPA
jgi:dinuclear metal center YbgI/SA1388 family protein